MTHCICGDNTEHVSSGGRPVGPVHYVINGLHHRPTRVQYWRTGMVIWNWSTNAWDRVKIQPDGSAMSYPIDEDDETEWRTA